MIVVILPERMLEVGLNQAYEKFNEGSEKFLTEQGIANSGPASKIVILFFIAVCCGVIGKESNTSVEVCWKFLC